jgi:hypothetical protein
MASAFGPVRPGVAGGGVVVGSPAAGPAARDVLWQHCRNNLGIARLLAREGRPEAMVATACLMAAEMACRTALEHAGFPFDGDVGRALDRLSAPAEVRRSLFFGSAPERLASAERAVAWVAGYLRSELPDRSWGY